MELNFTSKDHSSLTTDLDESARLFHNINTSNISNSSKSKQLTAETLRILSKIDIENLSFSSQFDLLFNDLLMLKASAVQGFLKLTNFRFLAWMIFLECIPMEKEKWIESIKKNRDFYEQIKEDICCDPHKAQNSSKNNDNESFVEDHRSDHPLSQEKSSTWNRYFWHNELKSVIVQDVKRM